MPKKLPPRTISRVLHIGSAALLAGLAIAVVLPATATAQHSSRLLELEIAANRLHHATECFSEIACDYAPTRTEHALAKTLHRETCDLVEATSCGTPWTRTLNQVRVVQTHLRILDNRISRYCPSDLHPQFSTAWNRVLANWADVVCFLETPRVGHAGIHHPSHSQRAVGRPSLPAPSPWFSVPSAHGFSSGRGVPTDRHFSEPFAEPIHEPFPGPFPGPHSGLQNGRGARHGGELNSEFNSRTRVAPPFGSPFGLSGPAAFPPSFQAQGGPRGDVGAAIASALLSRLLN